MSLTLTLNGAFRAVLGSGLLGFSWEQGSRLVYCALRALSMQAASQLSAHHLPVPMTPPQPALQGEGSRRLEGNSVWMPRAGGVGLLGSR